MGYQGSRKARLEYLLQNADGTLAQVTDLSVLAEMLAIGGDVSDYSSTTDSLEAIADSISSIPTTAMRGTDNAFLAAVGGALDDAAATGAVTDADTAMAYLKQLVTAIQLIPTTTMRGTDNAALASVLGALDDAAATGAVTDADTGIAYLKQLVTAILNGTYGLSALQTLLAAIPTTAMRGTDSAALASVMGALDDASASGAVTDVDTAMAYIKQIVNFTESGGATNVPQFVGTLAYADASAADDTGSGLSPNEPKKTIAAAQVVAGIGGAVTIKAGTYAEDVVMSYAAQELWPEIGTVFDGTGTCITISANSCRLGRPGDRFHITPAADQIGVVVTAAGTKALINGASVSGAASAGGFDINGTGTELQWCRATGMKAGAKAFDSSVSQFKFINCSTTGDTTSYGFYAGGATISRGLILDCTSAGHQTSGFYMDSNVSLVTLADCSSGAGDGRWKDVDNANAWCGFCFDDEVVKENTLSVAGGGGTEAYNLFKVTGAVKIVGIHADVETALTGTNTDCFLELYSANGSVEISKDDDGVTLGALGKGSLIIRLDKEDKVLVVGDVTSGPAVIDQTDVKEEGFRVIQDRTGGVQVDTYIRFVHTCADTGTGVLDWHATWEPVDGDGFLEAV